MCHVKPPTYYHVVDESNGEHIATFSNLQAAINRRDEEHDFGRDWATITTTLRVI